MAEAHGDTSLRDGLPRTTGRARPLQGRHVVEIVDQERFRSSPEAGGTGEETGRTLPRVSGSYFLSCGHHRAITGSNPETSFLGPLPNLKIY
jgi:hypothetical protein